MSYTPPDFIGGIFSDIEGHWARSWIEYLAQEGIIAGHPDGTFRPNQPLTRAQACVVLAHVINRSNVTMKALGTTHFGFQEDYDRIGYDWYYFWGASQGSMNDPKYVPMLGKDTLPTWFPTDYDGWLLVFNEPNNPEPYGRDIDPIDGANIYATFRNDYPQAKMLVGGISAWCDVAGFGPRYAWVEPFLNRLDVLGVAHPEYWHIHGYVEAWITADILIEWWRKHRQLTGAKYWVTEFAAPDGTVADVAKMVEFMKSVSWIERFSYYTNRLEGTESFCPPDWELTVPAVDWNTGELTEIGKYLASI